MKQYGIVLLGCLCLLTLLSAASAEVMRLDYEGFTVWLDCDKRGAVKFRYNAQRDQGEFKRSARRASTSSGTLSIMMRAKSTSSYIGIRPTGA